ncbi:flagellar hook protein FlgE [Noviherbaspirillum sp. UKPF54]|uniref:flagellar hook protein FlgE n=1 Tax=Noviherbaspirillum sp. UKPF54 TaxID=2601898 RepID=UPI0011B18ACE|nr:flagellar hook protein FlgE [Noviherbaspirillum sp. UKPF54]QDZ28126.1 flagellar hook protein FlgE [Noviherbaspirillum sp. UKPF54]
MAFQQGLSGLNAASKTMETIGNNVANAGTVGFKKSQAQFADVYASSLIGSGASPIGIGTKLARVSQSFTQANITGTNNPLDIAINGDGFFRMADPSGAITYTRNGQFQLNKNGNIENANGSLLTGYPVGANGAISNGAAAPLRITNTALAPKPTDKYNVNLNLDSGKPVIGAVFDPTDPTTYTNQTSVGVYDSLGNSHVLSTFYVNRGPAAPGAGNTWDVYATVDGTPIGYVPPAAPVALTSIAFSTGGVALATPAVNANLTLTNGATSPQAVSVDFSGTTQYALEFGVRDQTQNGYTAGNLVSFNLSPDGKVVGSYTNGQTYTLGQVALARFADPNGLLAQGDNQWVETSVSGPPVVSTPGNSGLGVVQSSAVEESNVDLTAELVSMITAQRIYQANAQTIKTEDQIMQTLVNLR